MAQANKSMADSENTEISRERRFICQDARTSICRPETKKSRALPADAVKKDSCRSKRTRLKGICL